MITSSSCFSSSCFSSSCFSLMRPGWWIIHWEPTSKVINFVLYSAFSACCCRSSYLVLFLTSKEILKQITNSANHNFFVLPSHHTMLGHRSVATKWWGKLYGWDLMSCSGWWECFWNASGDCCSTASWRWLNHLASLATGIFRMWIRVWHSPQRGQTSLDTFSQR